MDAKYVTEFRNSVTGSFVRCQIVDEHGQGWVVSRWEAKPGEPFLEVFRQRFHHPDNILAQDPPNTALAAYEAQLAEASPPTVIGGEDDPRCVCGVSRSEHALCGCEQFARPDPRGRRAVAGTCADCWATGLRAEYDPVHADADELGFVIAPCSCAAGEALGAMMDALAPAAEQ